MILLKKGAGGRGPGAFDTARGLIACCAALALAACNTMPLRDDASYAATAPAQPAPVAAQNGAIYQTEQRVGNVLTLFEDHKAMRVGDTLTIVLVEKTQASKNAKTSISKEGETSIAGPTVFGRPVTSNGVPILEQELSSSSDFDGSGASSQGNSLSGNITVTVAEVLSNGNLVVRGEKRLTLNQGDEYIQISGIVRPSDISGENRVLSTQLADARIRYSGSGAVADSNVMGWLQRFFISAIWPF